MLIYKTTYDYLYLIIHIGFVSSPCDTWVSFKHSEKKNETILRARTYPSTSSKSKFSIEFAKNKENRNLLANWKMENDALDSVSDFAYRYAYE